MRHEGDARPGEELVRLLPHDRAAVRQPELADLVRQASNRILDDWLARSSAAGLLTPASESTRRDDGARLLDALVATLNTGDYNPLRAQADATVNALARQGRTPSDLIGATLLLRDSIARSLVSTYYSDFNTLDSRLEAFRPVAANAALIATAAVMRAGQDRIAEQQALIQDLYIPVLPVRQRLVILPIIGPLDSARIRQLIQRLLQGIREHRVRVAVLDVTGVSRIDSAVASQLALAVSAARLLGAEVIMSGVSETLANRMVEENVDIRGLRTVGDLQGGIEQAEEALGYRLVSESGPSGKRPLAESEGES